MSAAWGQRPARERHLPIDRDATAQELGFERVAANSIDVSSDRDFALEIRVCAGDDCRAPERLGRGVDLVVDRRIQLYQTAARSSVPARRSCLRRSIQIRWS